MTTMITESYCPGDATKYNMLLIELPRGVYDYDSSLRAYILCVQNMGICFTFCEGQFIDESVIAKELLTRNPWTNPWTMRAMAEWIHLNSGVSVIGGPIPTVEEMRGEVNECED